MTEHICMVNPPSPFLINDKGAPPLGILHLAAECMNRDIGCSFWDIAGDKELAMALASNADEIAMVPMQILHYAIEAYAENNTPIDLFAITATSAQYESAKRIMLLINKNWPQIPVAIGGSHVSTLPQMAIDDGFDQVVVGEADIDWPNHLRLWGAKRGEKLILRCKAPSDLNGLQFPARQLVDLPSYRS